MNIEQRTLRSLEWERLTTYLAEQAETPEGKQRARDLVPPAFDPYAGSAQALKDAQKLLDQTEEAAALISSRTAFTLAKLADVRESLSFLRAGAVVSAMELARIKILLVVAKQVRGSLSLLTRDQFPHLLAFVEKLVQMPRQIEAIDFAIDDFGNVKDSASPALKSLRKERLKLDSSIKDELNRIIQSQAGSKALQEPIYTMRDGRYVVPVMSNMRYMLDGIVHDASQSGLTVYVEPLAVVELSNQTRIKDAAIEEEIERIVSALCSSLTPFADAMSGAYKACIELDSIMARARLSLSYSGVKPEISSSGAIELRGARHPLLILQAQRVDAQADLSKIVENTVVMREDERTLIITGPNTGGKTVLLKLIGLYAFMLRCGLLLPVRSGSSTPLFNTICADIGDEQSLEQSLSTFSAHMKNVVEIVNSARPGMLVLLDEIGAGTDPKEGAALARAVLEHLTDCGVATVATTHLGELKMLAYSDSRFVNGSFEFDDSTFSPTYRLRLGIPGSSRANIIAQRLGLDDKVVARARDLTEKVEHDLERIIDNLNQKLAQVDEQQRALDRRSDHLGVIEQKLDAREEKIALEQERVRVKLAAEMEEELKAAREILKEMIASLQREPSIKAAQKTGAELEALKATISFLQERQKVAPKAESGPAIAEGMTVRLKSLNNSGIVQEIIYRDKEQSQIDKVLVQVGPLKVKVAPEDLEIRGSAKVKDYARRSNKAGQAGVSHGRRSGKDDYDPVAARAGKFGEAAKSTAAPQYNDPAVFVRTSSNTIDLRGKRADEAAIQVEEFVDYCANHSISPLMIIHGHGTGALKTIVRQFLSSARYANRQRSGETYEGGDGVTIVELGE